MKASWLANLDRRIIFLILALVMCIPLLFPISMPLSIAEQTKKAYSIIDSLKPGDVVVIMPNYSPNAKAENHPQLEAMMAHVLKKTGVKVITASFWEMGPLFAHELWEKLGSSSLKYGEDYVELGYAPGGETAMAAFANDVHKTFPVDYYGRPVSSLPLMKQVKTAKDIALIISAESGTPGTPELIRQIQTPYKTRIIGGYAAQFAPTYMPYFNSGQVVGFLAGLRGAAEYEILLGRPGQGLKNFGAVTFSMLLVLLFIAVANLAYFQQRQRKTPLTDKS